VNTRRDYSRLGRTLVAAVMLSVLLAFVAVPRSQADDRANCQRNIERAQARLDQAISRYGGNSQQAIDRWHQLNFERERCYKQYQGWWNPQDRQWQSGREWDRYDCQRNAEQAQARLDQAIRTYGGNSQQAIDRWHQLNYERERCYKQYQGWWNPQDRQWHNGRDWDRYDQERGRDHDKKPDHDHDRH